MYLQERKCIYQQDLENLKNILTSSNNITIFTHANADPDALSSSCVLAYIVNAINRDAVVSIVVPEGIGIECRKIMELCLANNLKIFVARKKLSEDVPKDSLCFLVDVASAEQLKLLKNYLSFCSSIVIIDHHSARDLDHIITAKKILEFLCPNASSTSEIIFTISNHLKISIPKELLEMLLAGILWDTKRFLRSSTSTFECVSEILKHGADYYASYQLISMPKPYYTKIAKIKCILRHKGFKVLLNNNEVYVALSEVGAYESECASMLINIGYDIAFIASEDETLNAIRVIYRIRDDIELSQNINIYNDILKKVVEKHGGGGGGHRLAGGAIINLTDVDVVLKEIIEVFHTISGGKVLELIEHKVLEG